MSREPWLERYDLNSPIIRILHFQETCLIGVSCLPLNEFHIQAIQGHWLITIYAILHPCFSINFPREENYHNTFNSDVLEARVEEGIV